MWRNVFLLLLHSVEAAVASQCRQGATFSEAVVSPALESSGIVRVADVASLQQCVAACCDLPDYDLAWLFEGSCYILNCQQRENCRPRKRAGADSVLAFLRRASPQTLVSLVRGEPYSGRWRPLYRSSEAPGDLEALKDLALFNGPRQDFPDPGVQDVDHSEERGGPGSEGEGTEQPALKGGDGFNQSEAADGPERDGGEAQNRGSSGGNISGGDEDRTRSPTAEPPAAERTTETESSADPTAPTPTEPPEPTTDATQHEHIRMSLTTPTTSHQPISTSTQPGSDPEAHVLPSPADRPLMVSLGNPAAPTPPAVTPATDVLKMFQSAVGAPPTSSRPPAGAVTSDPSTTSTPSTDPPTRTEPSATSAAAPVPEVTGSNRGPRAVVGPDRKLFLPVSGLSLDGSRSSDDRGIVSYRWDAVRGPPGLKLEGVDQAVATATGLQVGRYTFRLTVSDQEGATDSAALTVQVQEARSLPPVAHASGSHTLTLPNNSLVLRGSVTDGDQTEVHYLWVRDSQSPAAGVGTRR